MNVICLTFPQPHIILSTYNNVALRSSISARQSVKMHALTHATAQSVQWPGYVHIPAATRYFSLLQVVQNGCGAHPTSERLWGPPNLRTALGPTQLPNGCGAHPISERLWGPPNPLLKSYRQNFFSERRVKQPGAWSWPLAPIQCQESSHKAYLCATIRIYDTKWGKFNHSLTHTHTDKRINLFSL